VYITCHQFPAHHRSHAYRVQPVSALSHKSASTYASCLSSFRLTLTVDVSRNLSCDSALPASNKHTHTRAHAHTYICTRVRAYRRVDAVQMRCDRGDDRSRSDRSRELSKRIFYRENRRSISPDASETFIQYPRKHLIPRCRNFPVVIRSARQLSVALHSKIPTFAPATLSADIDRHPLVFFVSRIRRNFRASPVLPRAPAE